MSAWVGSVYKKQYKQVLKTKPGTSDANKGASHAFPHLDFLAQINMTSGI